MYFVDYGKLYTDKLLEINQTLRRLASFSSGASDASHSAGLYDMILDSRLSETINDTSLILREMFRLKERGWAAKFDRLNRSVLASMTSDTNHYLRNPRWGPSSLKGINRLKSVIRHGIDSVDQALPQTVSNNNLEPFDLALACKGYLGMAEELEILMGALLTWEEEVTTAPEALNDIAHHMKRLNLVAR